MPDSGFFRKLVGGDDAFLTKKQFDGKMLRAEGTRTTTGVVALITPATGKTFYLMKAVGMISATIGAASDVSIYQLRNNTTIRERARIEASSNPNRPVFEKNFRTRGDSLDGDGIIDYDLNISTKSGSIEVAGMLFGFIEDTGDDPLA